MHFPRSSGILLHPTSLPGPHGSGDLGPGAYHFVDWLVSAGQTLWQILPLGSIGPGNSPYMSLSAFAGNPLLVDLGDLVNRGWLPASELGAARDFSTERVEFARVIPFRMHALRRAWAGFKHAGGGNDTELAAFRAQHSRWLEDYALFSALIDKFGGKEWCEWDPGLARHEPAALAAARAELADEIGFQEFVQWNFFRQWLVIKQYANQRGVKIIGDIPIFIAYQSAEVWANQHLFELGADLRPTVVAGVPPDFFSATGQRWGNPLYRWSAHEKEGYAWWIERVRATVELTDIVRIDHFRGFAGYWEIPASEPTAIKGQWLPGPGAKLFEAINKGLGNLPIIAEDLGVMTPDVLELRDRFELPGMRILQFAFAGDAENSFLPHNYIANTVVYSGTHDNDTTRGWFDACTDREQAFVQKYLMTAGHEIHWDLIHAASQSVADMAIYPLQDVLGLGAEARMNLPGKGEGNWEWRFGWHLVQDWHGTRLREVSAVHGRNGITPLPLPDYPEGMVTPS